MVGLLIFLAWHHHYLEKQQIYQYLCLLSGMAEDLGLSGPNTHGPGATIERDRAFLGCYYLCSCLSQKAFNKPNPLRWSDNLRRCAENVARAGNLPTDPNLVAMTELAQALDNFNEELQATTALKQPAYVPSVEMHAKMTGNRLKSLKREHPSLSINVALAAAMIDTHQRRLNATPDNASILIKCACDISEYSTYIYGQKGASNHVVATCSLTLTELTFASYLYCLRHLLTPLPITFSRRPSWPTAHFHASDGYRRLDKSPRHPNPDG